MQNDSDFFGYQTRWTGFDRYFLIRTLPDGLLGGRIGGQIISLDGSQEPRDYADRDLLNQYLSDLSVSQFLSLDRRNFFIPSSAVAYASIQLGKHWWTADHPSSGTLLIHRKSKAKKRFILLGTQNLDSIRLALNRSNISLR